MAQAKDVVGLGFEGGRSVKSILFICTGNVFRSLAAEYALKARLRPDSGYVVASAGIEALPQPVHPLVRNCLLEKGVDPMPHVPRRLTRELLHGADIPVAMGLDHREFIRKHFHRDVPLFNQICYQKEEPILDIHEVMPGWPPNREAARDYVISTIAYIWDAMPTFLARLSHG
ncbi:MAG: hypothetical protein E6K63_00100 [Nitrospirae bacterium]|nr:MAG: hypothetical protein E6K63_00100 [Nitrospirota bacterium]